MPRLEKQSRNQLSRTTSTCSQCLCFSQKIANATNPVGNQAEKSVNTFLRFICRRFDTMNRCSNYASYRCPDHVPSRSHLRISASPHHAGTQAHRHTGTQAHRHTGTQAHRHTGTQAHGSCSN
ncbi:hypothetical protein XF_1091 [Xylella fastidiosa 9a5c]|uniref:Uncharacterized protein n=1 Tax=Xylella fastidiosa (strain 9a5c) TaxID=160492 RepID=Q9PED7_XYLFA|nr:hypothetical protein XF_1091 [Xylella fastidiosa 9a5c]